MKQLFKRLFAGSLVLLAVAAIPAGLFLSFSYAVTWKYCAEFDPFKREFQTVADYVLLESMGTDGFYNVSQTETGEKYLYDPQNKCRLDCPEEVISALSAIDSTDAFPDKASGLDIIYFSASQVKFQKEGGSYALVYSPAGKPTYWHSPADGHSILVKTIGNGWYHVVVR